MYEIPLRISIIGIKYLKYTQFYFHAPECKFWLLQVTLALAVLETPDEISDCPHWTDEQSLAVFTQLHCIYAYSYIFVSSEAYILHIFWGTASL